MSSTPTRPWRLRRLMKQPAVAVWCAFLFLFPFYVFKSGLPQPGDMLVILLAPMVILGWNGRLSKVSRYSFSAFAKFIGWVLFIDLGWTLVLWDASGPSLMIPLFYLFDAAVFLSVLLLYRRYGDPFLRLTMYVVFATVVFQVAASLVRAGGTARHQVFFQNPNELGYYALLCASLFAITRRRLGIPLRTTSIGLALCFYLALLSASRAAVAGSGLLLVFIVAANPRVIVAAAVVALALSIGGSVESSLDEIQTRVTEKRNANLTFFEERGYDRIWNNKEYVLLGAGEGHTYRFRETTTIKTAEIHSSLGTIVFCYGILGVYLFFRFLASLMKGAGLRWSIMLLPALFYSVAHQGLRFTMLWILFALFVVIKDSASRPRPIAQPAGAPA